LKAKNSKEAKIITFPPANRPEFRLESAVMANTADHLVQTRFKPGVSGNPTGRPRKRPASEAYDDLLRMEIPDKMRHAMNQSLGDPPPLKKGATWADAMALGVMKRALTGDAAAAKELREGVEGKSTQRIELAPPEDRTTTLTITFAPAIEKKEKPVIDVKAAAVDQPQLLEGE
jgi:hypothetical protein